MLTIALVAVMSSQAAVSEDCLARWSLAGLVPGMKAASIQMKAPHPADERFPQPVVTPSQIDGLSSRATASVCVDRDGTVSLVRIELNGSRAELKRDLEELEKRWSRSVRLELGVSDSVGSGGLSGAYEDSIYDSCGWNALLRWSDDRAGVRGITIGVRKGTPEFVTAQDNNYMIDHDVLGEVEWQYAFCKPWPSLTP